jgi:pimeloyl-ACP methyl ester carboxylesterase
MDGTYGTRAFDRPHARIDTPEGRLAYWRFGSGPDVVAIHGWPLHSGTFRALLPRLVDRFSVHLFDLPGAGKTEWNGRVGFPENAQAVRQAVDAVGLRRYALLAHDSGGAVARLVAAGDARVAGLVLAGTEIPGHHSPLLRAYLWAARVPGMVHLLGALIQVRFVRRSPLAFGTCFTDPAHVDGEFAELFVRPLRRRETARGQMALLRSFDFAFVDSLADVHPRITAPTLCIWGESDPFFPVEKARGMLPQFAGGAQLVSIRGAKLLVHEDHAEEFASHARPFLAQCLAERPGVAAAARGLDPTGPS